TSIFVSVWSLHFLGALPHYMTTLRRHQCNRRLARLLQHRPDPLNPPATNWDKAELMAGLLLALCGRGRGRAATDARPAIPQTFKRHPRQWPTAIIAQPHLVTIATRLDQARTDNNGQQRDSRSADGRRRDRAAAGFAYSVAG